MINTSWISSSFNLFILSLVLVNDPQALCVNSTCLKCISDLNAFKCIATNEKWFTISVSSYLWNEISSNSRILLKGVPIPKLLNIPLASCFLINLYFLLSHITHFDKSISFPLFIFATLEFLISVFFLLFKQHDNIVLYIVKIFR